MAGVEAPEFKALPVQIRARVGLRGLAKILTQISDQQISVAEQEGHFVFSIHRCPSCWGRTGADQPVCYLYIGILQEGIEWITGRKECLVKEVKCAAQRNLRLMNHP
jgi:predicted hydrocarbon binding protein